MSGLEIFLGVALLLFSIAIVMIILLQEGQQQNLSIITGGVDTFLSKNKARSIGALLSHRIKVIAVGFFVVVIAVDTAMFLTGK